MMNPQTIEDLLDHAHRKVGHVLRDTAQLFDDQDEQNVFFMALFGRVLVEVARQLHKEEGELESEVLITTAMVLAVQMDRGRPSSIDQGRCQRRALAIATKLRAAAGKYPGD